jgi:hypothetical protein
MTDSQRKAMEQANDVWIDLRMAGVNSSEANILPHVERIAAALEAAFAEGKRQSNGATQEQLRQARAEALEEAAKEAEKWWPVFDFDSFAPTDSRRFANPNYIAARIRFLSSEAPAAREGGERG